MTLPKSWKDIKTRRLIDQVIEWDGKKTSEAINLPVVLRPLHVAIDNADLGVNIALTLEHHLRIDDGSAIAVVGKGANAFYTVTVDAAGPAEHAIQHVLPADPEGATDLTAALAEKLITVTLAVDAEGDPDDAKNTAALIAAAVNTIDGFTAVADGTGEGTFDAATDPISFADVKVDVYAPLYDADGNELSLAVNDNTRKVFGPFLHFPRYLGGRLVLTSSDGETAPADGGVTIVQVVEG